MLRSLVPLALIFFAAVAIALVGRSDLRAAIVAVWNDPTSLPFLPEDSRIHYEPAARACAERIAGLLPGAIAQIEEAQGRPFARPPQIGVYASYQSYARANGLGDAGVAAVTRAGWALLSPTLCEDENERLGSVVTHELSHVHLFGWRPRNATRPPAWFTEGLAVAVSGGGGAEGLSDDEARRAIRSDVRVILDDVPWTNFAALRFSREPACAAPCNLWTYRQRLAFRQAGLFVSWLRELKPEAFRQLLRDLEQGADFQQAFAESFGHQWENYWERLIKDCNQ
jgi:hypothetical protein